FAMSSSHGGNRLVIHGAAFAAGDDGVLIAGPKRAGKTSLLIHSLQTAGRQFISNDRVVVDLAAGEPVLHGMATLVTGRDRTLSFVPEFERMLLERNYDYRLTLAEVRQKGLDAERKRSGNAFDITPAQFCALIRVGVQSQSPARMVLFPQLSETSRGIRLRKLSPSDAATRLRASLFGSSAPGSTSEVF